MLRSFRFVLLSLILAMVVLLPLTPSGTIAACENYSSFPAYEPQYILASSGDRPPGAILSTPLETATSA